jgi:radical S-adenosyl methionine domain-containing protein 2
MLPAAIDLRITGRCDLRCPFCFGPRHEMSHHDIAEVIRLVEWFPTVGVRSVVVTGGEPTLVKGLPKLLRAAKHVGLMVVLSTNGLAFTRRVAEIAPYVDWVGLPLDADTAEANAVMRVGQEDHFRGVIAALSVLRRSYPHVRVKLGTVVSRLNRDAVRGIPRVLAEADGLRPDIWKLYQVAYSSYGEDNRQQLELSDEEFAPIEAACRLASTEYGIPFVSYWRSQRAGSYLFFEPNGDARAVTEQDEIIIGNFFLDADGVMAAWQRYVDATRVSANFERTYPE